MNVLKPGDNDLVAVDYSDLLEQIFKVLSSRLAQNPFRIANKSQQLFIDIDTIATQVAAVQVENPLGASAHSARAATVNFSPGFAQQFPGQVQQIKDSLQQLLEAALNPSSIPEFVTNLATNLENFRGSIPKLDLTYPFDKPYRDLQKQRLSVGDRTSSSKKLLKFHKLAIAVRNTHDFNAQLRAGLENYINLQFGHTNEREELDYILDDLENDGDSDFYRLKRILDTETLGKLKKEAQINYLEFLQDHINTGTSTANSEGAIYLESLIRRLRLIKQYISDIEKSDGHYQVNYAGTSANYRDLFSRADAFDMLPIIPKIEGYLGETTVEGEIQFIFGLKLKLNNPVPAYGGKTVFDYYLNLIDPDSEAHRQGLKSQYFVEKVLKLAFLYYFVFASSNPSAAGYTPKADLTYNPIATFEEKVLPNLKNSDEVVRQILRGIKRGLEEYQVHTKLQHLKQLLQTLLHRTPPSSQREREYPHHISVKSSILEREIGKIYNNHTFFKPVLRGNPKEVLKYISISGANESANSLWTIPATITISDIDYFSTDDCQSFTMEYDIAGIRTLPVLLVPKEDRCREIYSNYFKRRQLILFSYSLEGNRFDAQQAFIYRFTFSLLAYTCLRIILDQQNRLFIPIVRLHLSNREDDAPIEKFMASLSLGLSHLLNEQHRSNTQGVDIRNLTHKIPNVLSSLYSVLPKRFRFANPSDSPKLEKLAIVIVSSRESDARWGSQQKLSNLMGEVVGVRRLADGTVRLQLLTTFCENYDHQRIFKEPTVIIDEVSKVYQLGFRHFVYIAKAPYSSTLHMTQTKKDDGLFFMSRDVIRALKAQHDSIKLYPMFFDKYYVVNLKKIGASSLYIQDTLELTHLVEDPSKQSVVFFNLFNGIEILGEERNYNGVISYATLLNIYDRIPEDEDIRTGLIHNTPLKNDILTYLSLFHFSRYQAVPRKKQNISFKLDPYDNLIGEHSVGALSLFNSMRGKGNFNSLAFLTKVRNVLNL
ncbi:MAG TPA: hypothetical protein DDZ80_13375 [Cyanobacteria bacterium UBA8803]|nr:hypothetical protein [Cyanobacteria bacterium UBA9273]HBL59461.1 hypothetical protein [Cyanobacteria bacterium UBA8803]